MKQKLERIIKRNPFINKFYTFIGSILVRLFGFFLKKDKKTILFVSFMGKNFNDSPKVIYDKLVDDPYFKDYTFIWAFKECEKFKIKNKNTHKVQMDSFEYLTVALRASYWITNVNIERGLHFKKKYTKSINTWHGIPLKKIGNDVAGRNDFDFSDTNLFCYSGDYEYEIYKRAFKLTDQNLYKIGMPRNERLLENHLKIDKKINKRFNIDNKKIILYAPTWREDSNDLKLMDLTRWEKALSKEYVLLIKAHGLGKRWELSDSSFAIDVSDYEETSELLIAADILITDYSSIMFDYSLLERPIFIYMTDYDKYRKERGVYFDLRETELSIFEEDFSLLKHIQVYDGNDEKIKSHKFSEKFIEARDIESSQNIINLIKDERL